MGRSSFKKGREMAIAVDIGAGIGTTITKLIHDGYESSVGHLYDKIYAIEPEEKNFEYLNKTYYYRVTPEVIPIRLAIADQDWMGWRPLHITQHAEGHSFKARLLNQPEPIVETGEIQMVPVTTWDLFVFMFGIKKVEVCYVDIEGMEKEFILGMTTVYPKQIYMANYHNVKFEGAACADELLWMLMQKGYELMGIDGGNMIVRHKL